VCLVSLLASEVAANTLMICNFFGISCFSFVLTSQMKSERSQADRLQFFNIPTSFFKQVGSIREGVFSLWRHFFACVAAQSIIALTVLLT